MGVKINGLNWTAIGLVTDTMHYIKCDKIFDSFIVIIIGA